ncbi:498_t:CDS:2, partial [Paraglomus occultum]
YYAILGVSKDATSREIKKKYKQLSKKYHPDKNPGDKEAEQKFVQLAQAYEVLSDDEQRATYDRYGEEGLKGNAQEFHNPFDIFERFFGGGRHSRTDPEETKGPPIKHDVDVQLKELYLGKDINVDVSKQTLCTHCGGNGARSADDIVICSACGGRGVKLVTQKMGGGGILQMQTTCDVCEGRGKTIKAKCPHCKGKKVQRMNEVLTIVVEKGMSDGEEITMEKEGDEAPETVPGDIIFTLRMVPDPVFTRKGDDLYTEKTITLLESLVGFESYITHLDGRKIHVRRNAVTPCDFVEKLKGEGMPKRKSKNQKGDLYIQFSVDFPKAVNATVKEELKKYFKPSEHMKEKKHDEL